MLAVRVPPSAWITSQSIWMVRSPSSDNSATARRLRPIRRWISCVRPDCLPRATNTRTDREAARGKQSGRTQEIQRLIGRSLRAVAELSLLGERTIQIDCDVIQADGGTRTASITGAFVALYDAVRLLLGKGLIKESPLKDFIAAVSVGIYQGKPVLDLDYLEDSMCDTDMNVVMLGNGHFVEVQGTAEGHAFTRAEMDELLELAKNGITELIGIQRAVLEKDYCL